MTEELATAYLDFKCGPQSRCFPLDELSYVMSSAKVQQILEDNPVAITSLLLHNTHPVNRLIVVLGPQDDLNATAQVQNQAALFVLIVPKSRQEGWRLQIYKEVDYPSQKVMQTVELRSFLSLTEIKVYHALQQFVVYNSEPGITDIFRSQVISVNFTE